MTSNPPTPPPLSDRGTPPPRTTPAPVSSPISEGEINRAAQRTTKLRAESELAKSAYLKANRPADLYQVYKAKKAATENAEGEEKRVRMKWEQQEAWEMEQKEIARD